VESVLAAAAAALGVQHRLATAPGDGPLADLAAESATVLRREYGDHPLALAPAFR
jgi:hypothetical protein